MADTVYVVDEGLDITTGRLLLVADPADPPKWVDWGTGVVAAAPTDTTLGTPKDDEARVVGTLTQQTTSTTNDTLRCVATITCETVGAAITECGMFTHLTSTTGFLYLRATFSAINVSVADSIEFTIEAQYNQAA